LLAVRGFSRGESFVERNVGLRSTWRDGRWSVGITFMDHDDLCFATDRFAPLDTLPNMLLDERHVLRQVATLERIYRLGEAAAGAAAARRPRLRRAAHHRASAGAGARRRSSRAHAFPVRSCNRSIVA